MPQTIDIKDVRKLTALQRQKLMGAIWKSLVDEDANVQISDAAKAEIRRRRAKMREHPERNISYAEMRRKLRSLR